MCAPDSRSPFRRNNFFSGKLLTARDLAAEQQYFRDKQRLHNRCLHGCGIVTGLEVGIAGGRITVAPGFALDCHGNEIVLAETGSLPWPTVPAPVYVTVRYREELTEPVPGWETEGEIQYNRIMEGYELAYRTDDPEGGRPPRAGLQTDAGKSDALPLARLLNRRGTWTLDRRYRPPRVEKRC